MRQLGVACAVAGLCILNAGCHAQHVTKPSKPAPPSMVARPVVEREIDPLPLTPEQIDAVMGAKNMASTNKREAMTDDSALTDPAKECLALDSVAQAPIYAGSGFIAVRDQAFNDGDNFTHYAEQAVVLFPIAKQADAFFNNSAKQWPACRHFRHVQSGTQWDVGPMTNENGVLSTVVTQEAAKEGGWACGRALAVKNNVIVDVNTCSPNPGDSAVNIAKQIVAKVPMQ